MTLMTTPSPSAINSSPSPLRRCPSPGRFDLTPRSKYRALLAAFDDSENENDGNLSPRAVKGANGPSMRSGEDALMGESGAIVGQMEIDGCEGSILQHAEDDEDLAPTKRSRLQKIQDNSTPQTKRKKLPFSQKNSDDDSDSADEIPLLQSQPPTPTANELDHLLVNAEDSDEGLPANLFANPRLALLVAAKRKERKEKEAAEARARDERRACNLDDTNSSDDSSDDMDAKALESTIQPRQRRSAGKRALEEMARESQRMARGMQLVHEATTRRKVGKDELFAKFGFRPQNATATIVPSTEGEVEKGMRTRKEDKDGHNSGEEVTCNEGNTEEIAIPLDPTPATISINIIPKKESVTPPPTRLDKGKGRAVDPPTPKKQIKRGFKLPPVKVDFSKHPINTIIIESDDDIEIVDPAKASVQLKVKEQSSKYAALQARKLLAVETQRQERVAREKAQKDAIIQDLRKRSGNTTILQSKSSKVMSKTKMSQKQLTASLLQQSRVQALKEREEKIAELKARGVIILTAEERAKDIATVEEQMEKVRLEAERIKKQEKKEQRLEAIRKGQKVETDSEEEEGEDIPESEEESEEVDGNWVDEEGQEGLYELSGEEEEDILGPREFETGEEDTSGVEDFSDEEKSEEDSNGEAIDNPDLRVRPSIVDHAYEDDIEEDYDEAITAPIPRKSRKSNRIVDEDDEVMKDLDLVDIDTPSTPYKSKNPFATVTNPGIDTGAPLGLTQMFQSTIGDTYVTQPPSTDNNSKNPFANFPGLDMGAPLGLTQAFTSTIASNLQDAEPLVLVKDSQTKTQSGIGMWDKLRKAPMNGLENSQALGKFAWERDEMVKDTSIDVDEDMHVDLAYNQTPMQSDSEGSEFPTQASPSLEDLKYTQSQIHTEEDSYNTDYTTTQLSQFPNPTPDAGFQNSPIIGVKRFDTPKFTQTHVTPLDESPTQPMSPLAARRKRRRLLRATEWEEGAESSAGDEGPIHTNAFAVMKKAARAEKKREEQDIFKKKNSEAKKMVEEQAVESEDEWAGIGGVDEPSDDENDEKAQEELRDMIDDTEKRIDRNAIKAYYAEKEREDDARNVARIFKDLQNGGLRRKRNATDFDLSDSEDEIEHRRAIKRRNEARLRKLLEDNKISQIAANPKRIAFLQCLQDDDEGDSAAFLDCAEEQEQGSDMPLEDKKREGKVEVLGDEGKQCEVLQRTNSIAEDVDAFAKDPPLPRNRIAGRRKNASLAEIRERLSFLVEDADELAQEYSDSDIDVDELIGAPDTTTVTAAARNRRSAQVVDRILLKRAASSMHAHSHSSSSPKLAFHAPSSDSTDPTASYVPGLLRRATTNSQLTADSSVSTTTGETGGMVKKTGAAGKASTAINYHQREREMQRMKVVGKQDEKRRLRMEKEREKRVKAAAAATTATGRPGGVLGLLTKGRFS